MAETIDSFMGPWRFLSNFHHSPIFLGGTEYPTVEHAYQASKSLNPEDKEAIRLAPTPGKAQRMGQKVVLRSDWEEVKDSIMEACLRSKFCIGSPETTSLLLTGGRKLVEGNTWGDTYWGVCQGVGKNRLGELLMKIRAELEIQVDAAISCGLLDLE